MDIFNKQLSTMIDGLKVQFLTEDLMDRAFQLVKQNIMIPNNVHWNFGNVDVRDQVLLELEQLCSIILSDGFSVVAIDESTGNIMGVAFNKLRVSKD